MQRAAAAGADRVVYIDPHIFALQMVGQWLATRGPFCLLVLDLWTALVFAGEIAVEIFKSERQLVGIDAFRTAAELHSLQPFDDRSQALDLTLAMFDRADNIADQAMQKFYICREIVEIELHVRFYSNTLI